MKLLKMAKGIRALILTVSKALPQIGNLLLLFSLQFFIFSCLGVELFGRLDCSDANPCAGLGPHANFKNVGMGCLTLFRVCTGDNWNGILKDTLRTDCDRSPKCTDNCCTSYAMATIYFVLFVLLSQFVLLNVVVAMLMKGFEETATEEDGEKNKLSIASFDRKNSEQNQQETLLVLANHVVRRASGQTVEENAI